MNGEPLKRYQGVAVLCYIALLEGDLKGKGFDLILHMLLPQSAALTAPSQRELWLYPPPGGGTARSAKGEAKPSFVKRRCPSAHTGAED